MSTQPGAGATGGQRSAAARQRILGHAGADLGALSRSRLAPSAVRTFCGHSRRRSASAPTALPPQNSGGTATTGQSRSYPDNGRRRVACDSIGETRRRKLVEGWAEAGCGASCGTGISAMKFFKLATAYANHAGTLCHGVLNMKDSGSPRQLDALPDVVRYSVLKRTGRGRRVTARRPRFFHRLCNAAVTFVNATARPPPLRSRHRGAIVRPARQRDGRVRRSRPASDFMTIRRQQTGQRLLPIAVQPLGDSACCEKSRWQPRRVLPALVEERHGDPSEEYHRESSSIVMAMNVIASG